MEPQEVTFERTYDAPIHTVWQAWTDPQMLKQWWGPDHVTIPECTIDLHVGGGLYIVMEADEGMGEYKGTRWPMKGTFTAVDEPSRLSYTSQAWTEGAEETTTIDQRAELTLAEESGKTKMTLKVTLTKVGPAAGAAAEGMRYGFNQQFDKLAAFLTK